MAVEPDRAARLARRLRELRETYWPDAELTQSQLAAAFKVASATISPWESPTRPKTPSTARLGDYARFFSTRRSLDGSPHLISEDQLTPDEQQQRRVIEKELFDILEASGQERRSTFNFDDGPIIVICPDAPLESRGPLAREKDPNFTKLQQFGDLDALIEMYGHLRELNPGIDVNYRLASEIRAEDMSSHVILLGGVGWNNLTKRFQEAIKQVPVTQIDVKDYPGDIFEVDGQEIRPKWEVGSGSDQELLEDVAFLARLQNPFNINKTLTLCNGVHSRGVLGAVRCLTDPRVRETNEQYLDENFPDGRFALLLRVPVFGNETASPVLQDKKVRLYEWWP